MDNDYIKNMDYVDAIMVIDRHGKIVYSVRYNPRFDDVNSDLEYKEIINKNFLEIYPELNRSNSTMINAIDQGRMIYKDRQTFKDYKGRIITTRNLTIPIIRRGKILGAIELSKDITKVSELDWSFSEEDKFESENKFTFEDIITRNKVMLRNIEKAKLVANNPSSILIYGETGTGKELYVQSIHNYSKRKNKPFIVQNCAALPENLFESILFGTVKGAFTGAVDKAGLFEEADGGSLFLDEINSMPLNLQAKLLRVLQDGKIRRVGSNDEITVDVRIISAMNRNPLEAIELGEIRKDLFYRLSVVSLELLPLRERKEDIELYIDHFIKVYSKRLSRDVKGVTDEVLNLFLNYSWPGNVRELEHIIESSINFVEEDYIQLDDLPIYMSDVMETNYRVKEELELSLETPLDHQLELVEKSMIEKALERTGGNVTKASDILKITRQSLHYKMNKYNL